MQLTGSDLTRRSFAKCLAGGVVAGLELLADEPAQQAKNSQFPVSPSDISYLMADRAQRSDTLKIKQEPGKEGVKRFWMEDWRNPAQFFDWKVDVAEPGDYEITLMVSAAPSTRIRVRGPRNTAICETTWAGKFNPGYDWDRITLSTPLSLPKGQASIRAQLEKPVAGKVGAALKSIELLNVRERPRMDQRIRAFRSDTKWLREAKLGLMCQCGEWAYPRHGQHKPWPEVVDNFDVTRFADMADSTEAGYVVWSATWATYFFPAPIAAVDRILPGRTSRRDLIGELAGALAKRNIRLILYYHPGHETGPENGSWWSKNWTSEDHKSLFFDNWCSIIAEVGERYADRLAGWMFDDDLVYYPAPYPRLGQAAKAGSPSRIVSYNSWIQPRGTDFQDFQFGEGFMGDDRLPVGGQGIWPAGPMKGLQAHGCFQMDGPDWGIRQADAEISAPHLTSEKAIRLGFDAAARNEPLSWNLVMYDDGAVSERSLDVLRSMGRAVRTKYPRQRL